MPKKTNLKHIITLPSEVKKIVKEYSDLLPVEEKSHIYVITEIESVFSSFAECYEQLPDEEIFNIKSVDSIKDRAKQLMKDVNTQEDFNKQYGKVLVGLYNDQINVISLYNHLNILRGFELLKTFTRTIRTNEVFAISLAGRALLELGIVSADQLRHSIAFLKALESAPKNKVLIDKSDYYSKEIEEKMIKAIWGTRIGEGNLGDKKKTPLWQQNPMEGEPIARNMMTAFKGRANRTSIGKSAYKIYEVLCDIVHPSSFGYQLIFQQTEKNEQYKLNKGKLRQKNVDFIIANSLWAASHGCALISEANKELEILIPRAKEKLNNIDFDA